MFYFDHYLQKNWIQNCFRKPNRCGTLRYLEITLNIENRLISQNPYDEFS
jgi:hypothetical protein